MRWETGADAAARFANAAGQRGARVQQSLCSQARFWFFVRMSPRTDCEPDKSRPELFAISELDLCLRYELDDGDPLVGQSARDEFSRRFSEHFAAVAETHPILQRLKLLYDLTAAADAIHRLDRNLAPLPYLRRLVSHYAVAATFTPPRRHPLEECFGLLYRSDGLQHGVRVCGGIDFVRDEIADRVENLGYGILTELRALVLRSRPAADSLTWRVPLEGWPMPNAAGLPLPTRRDWDQIPWHTAAGRQSGASLRSESVVLAPDTSDAGQPVFRGFSDPVAAPPPKGVRMRMDLGEPSFRDVPTRDLESLREFLKPGDKAMLDLELTRREALAVLAALAAGAVHPPAAPARTGVPVYNQLVNLYRLRVLLLAIRFRGHFRTADLDPDRYLGHYRTVADKPMPDNLSPISNHRVLRSGHVAVVCGGVGQDLHVGPHSV